MPVKPSSPLTVSDIPTEARTNRDNDSKTTRSSSSPSPTKTGTRGSKWVGSIVSQKLFDDGNIIDETGPISSSTVEGGVAYAFVEAASPATVSATSFSSASSSSVSSASEGIHDSEEKKKNKSQQPPRKPDDVVEEKPNLRVEYAQKAHMRKRNVRSRLARPHQQLRSAATVAVASHSTNIDEHFPNMTPTAVKDDHENGDSMRMSGVAVQQASLFQTGNWGDFADTVVTFTDTESTTDSQHSSLDPCRFHGSPPQTDVLLMLAQEMTSSKSISLNSFFRSRTTATSEDCAPSPDEVQQEQTETDPDATTGIIYEKPTIASDNMPNDVIQQGQRDQTKECYDSVKGRRYSKCAINHPLRKQLASSSSCRRVKQSCSFSSLRLIDPTAKVQNHDVQRQNKTSALLDDSFFSAARKSRKSELLMLSKTNCSNAVLVTEVMTKSYEVKAQEELHVQEETAQPLDSLSEEVARIYHDSLLIHAPGNSQLQVQGTGSEATSSVAGEIEVRGSLEDAEEQCLKREQDHKGTDKSSRCEDVVNTPKNTNADNASHLLRHDHSGTDDHWETLGTSTSNEDGGKKVEQWFQRSSEHLVQNHDDTSVDVGSRSHNDNGNDDELRERTRTSPTSCHVNQKHQPPSPSLRLVDQTINVQQRTVHKEEKIPTHLDRLRLSAAQTSRKLDDSISCGQKKHSMLTFGTAVNGNDGPVQEKSTRFGEMVSVLLDSSSGKEDSCYFKSCNERSPRLVADENLLPEQRSGSEADCVEGSQQEHGNISAAAKENLSTTVATFTVLDQQHLGIRNGQEDSGHDQENSNTQCDHAVSVEQDKDGTTLLPEPANEKTGFRASDKDGYHGATFQTSSEEDETVLRSATLDLIPNHKGQSKSQQEMPHSSVQAKLSRDHDETSKHSNVTSRMPLESMKLAKDTNNETAWGPRRQNKQERKDLVDLEEFCKGNETNTKQRIDDEKEKCKVQEEDEISLSAWWDEGSKAHTQSGLKNRPKTSILLDDLCTPKEVDGKSTRTSFLDLVANHIHTEQELLEMLRTADMQRDEQDRREESSGDRGVLPMNRTNDQDTTADKGDCCKKEQPSFSDTDLQEEYMEGGNKKSLHWRPEENPSRASGVQHETAAAVNSDRSKATTPPPKYMQLVNKDLRVRSIHSQPVTNAESDNLSVLGPVNDESSFFEKYARHAKAARRQRLLNSQLTSIPHNVLRSIEAEKKTVDGDIEEDAEKADGPHTNQTERAPRISCNRHGGLDQPAKSSVLTDAPRQIVNDLMDAAAWHVSLGAPNASNDMVESMGGPLRQDGRLDTNNNQNGMNSSYKEFDTGLHCLIRRGPLKGPGVERVSAPSGDSYDIDTTTVNSSSEMSSESECSNVMSTSMLSQDGLSIVPSTSMTSVDAPNISSQKEALSADLWATVLGDLSVESSENLSLEMDMSHLEHGGSQNVLVEFWEALVEDSTESCGACISSKSP